MINETLRAGLIQVFGYVARLVLFPVALIACTPVILIRAAILAVRHRQTFIRALCDGYSSVDVFWWAT